MSKVAIQGNASGTGTFTIAAPNSNTDRTLTLPDEAGTVLTDTGLPSELNATGSAPIYACRAWVNFNGTGTPAIRASGNVSSITDNGTGDYTVNFTTAMPDANYSVACQGSNDEIYDAPTGRLYPTLKFDTSGFRFQTVAADGGAVNDTSFAFAAVFR